MPFDSVEAAEHLASRVRTAGDPPVVGWPFGCPPRELTRSSAASNVGHLAAKAGLGLFHTEWRHHLPLPEDWVPEHDPGLADPPEWGGGVLPERKYQAFRHDQALGGYHPGMRAKWAAHELCHGLVGFAWRPDASPLFIATAGRLSELVPVVLWYFLDEAHLVRCPQHRHGGALYRSHCPRCESSAAPEVDELFAESVLERGRAFVERELAAVRETLRTGVPVPHIYGSLDLCSDGIAYAAAHGPRLQSEAFHRFAEGFLVQDGGWVDTLDALEARALAVLNAIAGGRPLSPLAPTPTHGHARWVLQDLGWRMLALWHETDGEVARSVQSMVDTLASACARTASSESPHAVRAAATAALVEVRAAYEALHEEVMVPDPEAFFALGHDLLSTGSGRSTAQIMEGVADALPGTSALLGDGFASSVAGFLAEDRPLRVPIGRRFSTWLAASEPPEVCALSRYEAALTHLPPADPLVIGLGGPDRPAGVRLGSGTIVLREDFDVVELARNVAFGDMVSVDGEVRDVDGQPVEPRPTALVIVRSAQGEPILLDIPAEAGDALLGLWDGGDLDVESAVWQALVEHGALRPVRYRV